MRSRKKKRNFPNRREVKEVIVDMFATGTEHSLQDICFGVHNFHLSCDGSAQSDKFVKSRVRGALDALRKEGKAYSINRGSWLVFTDEMAISRNKGITEAFIALSDALSLDGHGADDFEDGGADLFTTAMQDIVNDLEAEEENYMHFELGMSRFHGYVIGLRSFAKLVEAMGRPT